MQSLPTAYLWSCSDILYPVSCILSAKLNYCWTPSPGIEVYKIGPHLPLGAPLAGSPLWPGQPSGTCPHVSSATPIPAITLTLFLHQNVTGAERSRQAVRQTGGSRWSGSEISRLTPLSQDKTQYWPESTPGRWGTTYLDGTGSKRLIWPFASVILSRRESQALSGKSPIGCFSDKLWPWLVSTPAM